MATETSSVDPTSAPTFVELGADPQIAEALADARRQYIRREAMRCDMNRCMDNAWP